MNRFWRFRCSELQAARLEGFGCERGLGFRKYLKRDTGAGESILLSLRGSGVIDTVIAFRVIYYIT